MYTAPLSPIFQYDPVHAVRPGTHSSRRLLHWNGLDGEPAEDVYLSWTGAREQSAVVCSSGVFTPATDDRRGQRSYANQLDVAPEFGEAPFAGTVESVSDTDWSTESIRVDDRQLNFDIRRRGTHSLLGVGFCDTILVTFLVRSIPLSQIAIQRVTSLASKTYLLNPFQNHGNEAINNSLS